MPVRRRYPITAGHGDDREKIQTIDAARAAILESCSHHGIDISTPTLIRSL